MSRFYFYISINFCFHIQVKFAVILRNRNLRSNATMGMENKTWQFAWRKLSDIDKNGPSESY